MKKILVVVDMQNDFVDGALGSKEAAAIVPAVAEKIRRFDGGVFVTYDTHFENYMQTAEGKKLPVPHCIKGTVGWELNAEVAKALENHAKGKLTFKDLQDLQQLLGEAVEKHEMNVQGRVEYGPEGVDELIKKHCK